MSKIAGAVVPTCCGRKMHKISETQKFFELSCEKCGDRAFVRKNILTTQA